MDKKGVKKRKYRTTTLDLFLQFEMDTNGNQRETIIRQYKQGKTQSKIASLLNINQSTVSRIISRYKKTSSTENNHKTHSKGKLALSIHEMRLLRRASEKGNSS